MSPSAGDESRRVPTIARWPGVTRAGTKSRAPILSVDYAPTVIEAAGVGAAAKPGMDGISIVPALKGATNLNRQDT